MAESKSPAEHNDDKTGNGSSGDGGPAGGARPQLNVLAQYIRDLSFENPSAPKSLQGPGDNPQLQVNVNVNASRKNEEIFEVALLFDAKARNDSGLIYNIEAVYCGLFRLSRVPDTLIQAVLFVDCPAILFPFLRRLVGDVTRDGGFPPLMLDPIDFGALYAQNLAKAETESKAGAQKN